MQKSAISIQLTEDIRKQIKYFSHEIRSLMKIGEINKVDVTISIDSDECHYFDYNFKVIKTQQFEISSKSEDEKP